jgi:ribosomal protein S27E
MIIYELTCLNNDGVIEHNGFYESREDAEKEKRDRDKQPYNIKYRTKQAINPRSVQEIRMKCKTCRGNGWLYGVTLNKVRCLNCNGTGEEPSPELEAMQDMCRTNNQQLNFESKEPGGSFYNDSNSHPDDIDDKKQSTSDEIREAFKKEPQLFLRHSFSSDIGFAYESGYTTA